MFGARAAAPADEASLRAALSKAEAAAADALKEKAAVAKELDKARENLKRGDAELKKAVRACSARRARAAHGRPRIAHLPPSLNTHAALPQSPSTSRARRRRTRS